MYSKPIVSTAEHRRWKQHATTRPHPLFLLLIDPARAPLTLRTTDEFFPPLGSLRPLPSAFLRPRLLFHFALCAFALPVPLPLLCVYPLPHTTSALFCLLPPRHTLPLPLLFPAGSSRACSEIPPNLPATLVWCQYLEMPRDLSS